MSENQGKLANISLFLLGDFSFFLFECEAAENYFLLLLFLGEKKKRKSLYCVLHFRNKEWALKVKTEFSFSGV